MVGRWGCDVCRPKPGKNGKWFRRRSGIFGSSVFGSIFRPLKKRLTVKRELYGRLGFCVPVVVFLVLRQGILTNS